MNNLNRCRPMLGTFVEIDLKGNFTDKKLINLSNKAFKRVEEIENLLSFYKEDSELSYVNANAYYSDCFIFYDLKSVLEKALQISKLTNGLYDISIACKLIKEGFLPNSNIAIDESANWQDIILDGNKIRFNKKLQLDLGGIAKGYAVDQALISIYNEDLDIIINAGGDIAMNKWQEKLIKVRSSVLKDLQPIKMQNRAVATSSSYFFETDKNPIINPKNGQMIKDKRSISIFASDCMTADALTKVGFLNDNSEEIIAKFKAKSVIL